MHTLPKVQFCDLTQFTMVKSLQATSEFLNGTGSCSVAQCYDKAWITLVQSKFTYKETIPAMGMLAFTSI